MYKYCNLYSVLYWFYCTTYDRSIPRNTFVIAIWTFG